MALPKKFKNPNEQDTMAIGQSQPAETVEQTAGLATPKQLSGETKQITPGEAPTSTASAAPKKSTESGLFTNIQSFLKAKPNQQAAQKIGQSVGTAIGSQAEAIGKQVEEKRTAAADATAQVVPGAQTEITSAQGVLDKVAKGQPLTEAETAIYNQGKSYTDPGALTPVTADLSSEQLQAEEFQRMQEGLKTGSGLQQSLESFFRSQSPNRQYSKGMANLDTQLLQQSPEGMKNLIEEAGKVDVGEILGRGEGMTFDTSGVTKQAQGLVDSETGYMQAVVDEAKGALEKEYAADQNLAKRLKQALATGDFRILSQEEKKKLGLGQFAGSSNVDEILANQDLGFKGLSDWLQKNYLSESMIQGPGKLDTSLGVLSGRYTDEQRARLENLAKLTGRDITEFMQQDPTAQTPYTGTTLSRDNFINNVKTVEGKLNARYVGDGSTEYMKSVNPKEFQASQDPKNAWNDSAVATWIQKSGYDKPIDAKSAKQVAFYNRFMDLMSLYSPTEAAREAVKKLHPEIRMSGPGVASPEFDKLTMQYENQLKEGAKKAKEIQDYTLKKFDGKKAFKGYLPTYEEFGSKVPYEVRMDQYRKTQERMAQNLQSSQIYDFRNRVDRKLRDALVKSFNTWR